jgi:hypothetical protein
MVSELARLLADTQAELADELGKLERGRKRSERMQRDHVAGRINAFEIAHDGRRH